MGPSQGGGHSGYPGVTRCKASVLQESGGRGSPGLEVQGGRWGQHLYLNSTICSCPGPRLPALGLTENMQLSCTRIWCSSVQSKSTCSAHSSRSICWSLGKRKALGKGCKAEGVEPLSQSRGRSSEPQAGWMEAFSSSLSRQALPCMAGQMQQLWILVS